MLKRLRRQLTAICAAGTALVLVGVTAVALRFPLERMEQQAEESFLSNLNTVFFYLDSQTVIDQTWLAQTEASEGLWLRIESRDGALQYTGQNPLREQLTTLAKAHAGAEYGYDPAARPSGSGPDTIRFDLEAEEGTFRAAVSSVSHGTGWLSVTILKSRAAE